MSGRFAVYLAPAPDSALWRLGSAILGRDAVTGEARPGFAPEGYDAERWAATTAEARRYGFHATMKAPFRLAAGAAEVDLARAVAKLAGEFAPFDLPLRVSQFAAGGGRAFVALRPVARSRALEALEAEVVRALDPYRAPLTQEEIVRRAPDRLTLRQRENLMRWGYPYVFDEFRLHFTLSGAVPQADALAASLERALEPAAPEKFRVDALALFAQPEDGDFVVRERFALSGR